jgi:copper resistance protein B
MNSQRLYGGRRWGAALGLLLTVVAAHAVDKASPEHAPEDAAQHDGMTMPTSGAHNGHTSSELPAEPAIPAEGGHAGHVAPATAESAGNTAAPQSGGVDMGAMQGGSAPPDARDPNAYSDGFTTSGMPGMEQTDRLVFGKVLLDEVEFLSGNEGEGFAWSGQANYGNDANKLWLRTQGLKVPGEWDATTDGEVLWWHPCAPFWGSVLGIRQDFGAGAHTYLAVGLEGLAPNWFEVQATAYLGDDGRVAARFKTSYDLRLTNRLILVPNLEANAYSRSEEQRGLGAGVGNVEGGLRLRYEFHRKFAPYVGYVWERSFAGTADRRRAEGDAVSERRFVAGLRVWW